MRRVALNLWLETWWCGTHLSGFLVCWGNCRNCVYSATNTISSFVVTADMAYQNLLGFCKCAQHMLQSIHWQEHLKSFKAIGWKELFANIPWYFSQVTYSIHDKSFCFIGQHMCIARNVFIQFMFRYCNVGGVVVVMNGWLDPLNIGPLQHFVMPWILTAWGKVKHYWAKTKDEYFHMSTPWYWSWVRQLSA